MTQVWTRAWPHLPVAVLTVALAAWSYRLAVVVVITVVLVVLATARTSWLEAADPTSITVPAGNAVLTATVKLVLPAVELAALSVVVDVPAANPAVRYVAAVTGVNK